MKKINIEKVNKKCKELIFFTNSQKRLEDICFAKCPCNRRHLFEFVWFFCSLLFFRKAFVQNNTTLFLSFCLSVFLSFSISARRNKKWRFSRMSGVFLVLAIEGVNHDIISDFVPVLCFLLLFYLSSQKISTPLRQWPVPDPLTCELPQVKIFFQTFFQTWNLTRFYQPF